MQNNLSKCNFTAVSYVYCNCKLYHFCLFSGDNGMLNKTILPFFGKEAINWYSESKYWPVILVIVNTWKGVGYGCLIYISSISGIDPSFMRLQNWMELQSGNRSDTLHFHRSCRL